MITETLIRQLEEGQNKTFKGLKRESTSYFHIYNNCQNKTFKGLKLGEYNEWKQVREWSK